MYKVIKNKEDLEDWLKVLPTEVRVINSHFGVKNSVERIVATLDTAYGENRRIDADLGGFVIVLFGEETEVLKHEQNVLKYFKLNADEYEYEDMYEQKEPECTMEVTFRLYLCSSDYAVQMVKVLKKENEYG